MRAGAARQLAITLLLGAGGTGAIEPAAPEPSPVVTAVAGILSYTRWPDEAGAVLLCTAGQGPGVAALQRAASLGAAQRPVSVQALDDGAAPAPACQAVYVGSVAAAAGRELLRRYAGRPVLLLGEGAAFCSDGGMFCLESRATQVRFNANLDAIARSGLRVSPLVLRIARGASGGGS